MSALVLQGILNLKKKKKMKVQRSTVRKFISRWIGRAIFILPLDEDVSSYWRPTVVSLISVFCKRQLLICKAAWSYIPFHIVSRLVLLTHAVTGWRIVLLPDTEGWLDQCGTVWLLWFNPTWQPSSTQQLTHTPSQWDGGDNRKKNMSWGKDSLTG